MNIQIGDIVRRSDSEVFLGCYRSSYGIVLNCIFNRKFFEVYWFGIPSSFFSHYGTYKESDLERLV